ncbi:hypothetical protein N7451_012119 [Penicillium sp. IBT 35674x]|nr:hypothetical protein N7451_012119 [Penicillium sp. IBT 35674x]
MLSSMKKLKHVAASQSRPSNNHPSHDKKHITECSRNSFSSDYFTNPSDTDYSATNTGSAHTAREPGHRGSEQLTARPGSSSSWGVLTAAKQGKVDHMQ